MPSLLTEQWAGDLKVWCLISVALVGGLCGWYGARLAQMYTGFLAGGGTPDAAMFRQALVAVFRPAIRPLTANAGRVAAVGSVIMACAYGALYWRYGLSPYFYALAAAATVLLTLALIDAFTGLLPDALTWPLIWTGLFTAWLGYGPALDQALAGVFLGYLLPWGIFFVYKCARGLDGMGYGDFKLLAGLGAWLGWQAVGPVLLGASLVAIVGAMWHQRTWLPVGAYPFGPFLIVSAVGFFVGTTALHSWFI